MGQDPGRSNLPSHSGLGDGSRPSCTTAQPGKLDGRLQRLSNTVFAALIWRSQHIEFSRWRAHSLTTLQHWKSESPRTMAATRLFGPMKANVAESRPTERERATAREHQTRESLRRHESSLPRSKMCRIPVPAATSVPFNANSPS